MDHKGKQNKLAGLDKIGIDGAATVYWNLDRAELVERTVCSGQGTLASSGALMIDTGEFTGRSPKDRFIVADDQTKETVDWGVINQPFDQEKFDALFDKYLAFLRNKDIYVRDVYACADPSYRLNVRVITEYPWQNLFADNMFLNPESSELDSVQPDWHVLSMPSFMADPEKDGTRQHNFAIINFSKKIILIGGTGYTGEIKKGIFSVLNYVLPHQHKVLSMHCSANVGADGDTAIFFGLSGTGKTTLSADPSRQLVGDDEHGWAENSVFNFEGGCYAKVINLSEDGEPQIYHAIKFGSILENVRCNERSREVDFANSRVTENTRVSYPIEYIENALRPSVANPPKNIFFLTCDAYGVLPPISRLTKEQAMYHFISGYTAKVAGTEAGITEPTTVFSACFGAPFLPLHPTTYAEMLGEKMEAGEVNVWLVNTGWTGGPYGVGERIRLKYTRTMISAALNGDLQNVDYHSHPLFRLAMPKSCPDVPSEILDPAATWEDRNAYQEAAQTLAKKFLDNFKKYENQASNSILSAAPRLAAVEA